MTWAKLGDEFGDQCAAVELSDAAFRTHVEALLWTMRRETGGRILRRDLKRFAETIEPTVAVVELLSVGFWRETPDGWQIVHAMPWQRTPEQIAHDRSTAAVRQRKRRKPVVEQPDDGREGHGVTSPVTHAVSHTEPLVWSGLDGKPQPRNDKNHSLSTDNDEPWPDLAIPGAPSSRPRAWQSSTWAVEWCGECKDEEGRYRYDEYDQPVPCHECHFLAPSRV